MTTKTTTIEPTIRALGDLCLEQGEPCNNGTLYQITTDDYFIMREPNTMTGDSLCIRDKKAPRQWAWAYLLDDRRHLTFHPMGLTGRKLATYEKEAEDLARMLYAQLTH